MKSLFTQSGIVVAAIGIGVCSAFAAWATDAREDIPPSPVPPRQPGRALPIVIIEARAFGRSSGEIQRLITTAADYRATLGAEPPGGLDFNREWVAVYAAGTLPTGGYTASISRVALTQGGLLVIETRLTTPGPNCLVTQVLTNPYTVVRFPRPEGTPRAVFDHESVVSDCR